MIFFTPEFAIILLVFLALYWFCYYCFGKTIQHSTLLLFNYVLLLWINPYFALVVFIYSLAIYIMSLLLCEFNSKVFLGFCIILCLLYLAFFKYFPDIKDSFDNLFAWFGLDVIAINFLFPLGISFYTFASLTYLCSVYRTQKHESFFHVAIFLSFFPTFVSGPILRSDDFFTQLQKEKKIGNLNLIFVLIVFGVVKKVLIADYLQLYSDPILQNPILSNSLELLLAIYAYSIRLYCDFSGYVDLVTAFALMIGFKLPLNFNMPYMAKNIKDFWARWHISLSLFIRDYIYIPLGGNRKGFFLTQIFVLISFALSGIWHGNTLNFLIWGLLHGCATIFVNILYVLKFFPKIPYINSIITFHFVVLAWIFFYYPSLDDALFYFQSFCNNITQPLQNSQILWFAICCCLFLCYPLLQNLQKICVCCLQNIPWILHPFIFVIFITLIIGFSPSGIPNFIYAGF